MAYVSRSGGMSNELNNIISMNTDGVFEGVAIGGDRYPGSTFFDHMKRYHDHPDVKMLVLLGEVSIRLMHWFQNLKFPTAQKQELYYEYLQVGGTEEYKIVEAIKDGTFHKPIVAWCIGTCARMFTSEV